MPTVSSLLKSAQATQKKIRTQEDALVAFEWENSAQTYDDFLSYSKYLQDQADKISDPSDNLTYQNKIRSARRSYTSNELQRQQMAIMEGGATTRDKMTAVQNLYQQAVDNGDMNLAQNLYSQWDALSIKAQNEAETGAKALASAGAKAYTTLTSDLTKGFDDVTLPTGETVTPLAAISRDLEQNGGDTATWDAARETLDALKNVAIDQYNNATTQEQIDTLEQKYGPGLADLDKNLTFTLGGKKLTSQDVINAAANEQINNPVYTVKATRNDLTGQTEYKLQENNVASYDYVRKLDENGNEYYDAVLDADGNPTTIAKATAIRTSQNKLFFGGSDQGRNLGTQITDSGEVIGGGQKTGKINAGEEEVNRDNSQTIGNRLAQLGYQVKQNGTTLTIKIPGDNKDREATIQPDGSIRYFGDDGQLNEVSVIRKNLGTDLMPTIVEAGQARPVSPDELSDFGANSTFGGRLSQTSNQGQRYIDSITGQTKVNGLLPGQTPITAGNNFSGLGAAATAGNFQGTSALLQGAQFTQRQVQQEQQRQQMLQQQNQMALQATSNQFNLNQTPVQQLANNGALKKQLQVAAPTPTPRVYVAASTPTPQINSVGVARPDTISSVGVASTPRVTVR